MKIILASHRAVMVLTAAGSYALATLLLRPYCEGIHPGWLAALAVIVTLVTVLVIGILSASIAPPTMHQALGGLLILTGIVLITL
ncbi:MAG: hypothetical protein V7698_18495 [Paracoccaceae bacterium]|uniref:hypothetical protein n=1 Tax=unclassified Seohaeicola TaxID=2641111 RepID=UPI00237AA24D|nr:MULTISPECIES: hypothetical protein [unclassified Seohaeicola]MDD9708935.1 hypothetical protein [Seohaeicola sp. 4SK31]MDD9737021.1 hypothetical protein [Seohaeicola sp. SP36]